MFDAELLERGASAGGETLDVRHLDEQEPIVVQDAPGILERLERVDQVLENVAQDSTQSIAARQDC